MMFYCRMVELMNIATQETIVGKPYNKYTWVIKECAWIWIRPPRRPIRMYYYFQLLDK